MIAAVTPIAPEPTPIATPLPEPSTAPEPSATAAAIATVEPAQLATAVATPRGDPVATATPPTVASPEPAEAVTPEATPVIPEATPAAPEPGTAPDAIATPLATAPAAATPWAGPVETATALPAASPEPAPSTAPDASPVALEATPVAAVATPVAFETATPVGAEVITVEAMTSDHEVTPGEPNLYRFQLTNTVGSAVAVEPAAVNSLDGWTGIVLDDDGVTRLDGPVTIGPWQSEIVIVEVTVPADARVGDRNTISLDLKLGKEPAEQPIEVGDLPEIAPSREPDGAARIAAGPRDGVY